MFCWYFYDHTRNTSRNQWHSSLQRGRRGHEKGSTEHSTRHEQWENYFPMFCSYFYDHSRDTSRNQWHSFLQRGRRGHAKGSTQHSTRHAQWESQARRVRPMRHVGQPWYKTNRSARKWTEEFNSRQLTLITATVSCWTQSTSCSLSFLSIHTVRSSAISQFALLVLPLFPLQLLLPPLASAHHHSRRHDEYISGAVCLECGINKQVTFILF